MTRPSLRIRLAAWLIRLAIRLVMRQAAVRQRRAAQRAWVKTRRGEDED